MAENLKQKTRIAIKWTSLASLISTISSMTAIIILVRLLEKTDFGLMALASVVIAFATQFVDMGISQGIIHKQNTSIKQLSTLYWINVFTGIFIFFLIINFSSFIAQFYESSKLSSILNWAGISFIFMGFGVQFQAILRRDLRFETIAKIEISSTLSYLGSTIVLAYLGYGVYALVWGTLIKIGLSQLLFIWQGIKIHQPVLAFHLKEVRFYIKFGLYQMGTYFFNYFNNQIDTLLIGKLLGMEVLGIYSVLKRTLKQPIALFNPIVNKVTFPILAKANEDSLSVKNIYLKLQGYLNSLRFPIYIFLMVAAAPVIEIFLDTSWRAYHALFQILAAYLMLKSHSLTGKLMLARGRADWIFYWNLLLSPLTPIFIYIGSYWGLTGITTMLVCRVAIIQYPKFYFLIKKVIPVNALEYFAPTLRPLGITGMAAVFTYPVIIILHNVWWQLLISGMVFTGLCFVFNFRFNKGFLIELKTFIPVYNNYTIY